MKKISTLVRFGMTTFLFFAGAYLLIVQVILLLGRAYGNGLMFTNISTNYLLGVAFLTGIVIATLVTLIDGRPNSWRPVLAGTVFAVFTIAVLATSAKWNPTLDGFGPIPGGDEQEYDAPWPGMEVPDPPPLSEEPLKG